MLFSIQSRASFIAVNGNRIDNDKKTHILVAGAPDKLGKLFIYSLLTRVKIYLEKDPGAQIIIIGRSEERSTIEEAGFKVLDKKSSMLKPDYIKSSFQNVRRIKSFDLFAHSNALSGASLDSNSWITQLLNEKDDLWTTLSDKMDNSSYIFIHGCNAGVKLAPAIASQLKLAVFAALTSTDFQYIYDDAFWSFDYNADSVTLSKKNNFNFLTPKSCGKYCTRMKPDNSPYKGYWGDWSAGGYPTFKLFCGAANNEKCEKGAVEGVLTFPGPIHTNEAKSDLVNFKKQLVDFMCPFAHNLDKQNKCQLNLENSQTNEEAKFYSPFKGKTLSCDQIKCKAHFECSFTNAAFNPGACKLVNDSPIEKSTAFTDDYNFIINAFEKHYLK